MPDRRIQLILEGMHGDDGHVRLHAFIIETQLLSGLLGHFDRLVSGGKRLNHFRIVDVSHRSPLTLVLEAQPNEKMPREDSGPIVIQKLMDSAEQIEKGQVPTDLEYDILSIFRHMAQQTGEKIESVTVATDTTRVELTRHFAARIDTALSEIDECYGTIEGTLEQLNIHAGANVFSIYPQIGAKKVACHFRKKDLDEAKFAIGCDVAVRGMMRFRPQSAYPYEILVDILDTYPPEDELPTMLDLHGIAPNATDIPAEDFIAGLRDAWED